MKTTTAQIGIIQRRRKDRNGQCPLYLYVAWKGRAERATGIACQVDEWDKKKQRLKNTVPNASILNSKLLSMVSELEKRKARFELEGVPYTAKYLIDSLGKEDRNSTSFEELAESYVKSKMMSYKTSILYKASIRLWQKYMGHNVSLLGVDSSRLKQLYAKMRSDGYSETTLKNLFMRFSAVYRHAIENGVEIKNAVNELKLKRPAKVNRKVVLDNEQFGLIKQFILDRQNDMNLERKSNPVSSCCYYYMMAMFSGLAPVDMALLKVSDIKFENDVRYINKKRRKTGKGFFIIIPDDDLLQTILLRLTVYGAHKRGGYLLPVLDKNHCSDSDIIKRVQSFCVSVNTGLKKAVRTINLEQGRQALPESLRFYSARHYFATTFLSKSTNITALCSALGRSPSTISYYIAELTSTSAMKDEIKKVFGC